MFFRARRLACVAALLLAALAACGSGAASADGPGSRLVVGAAFYPLQFAAERVGGTHVEVHGLTRPGAEPHDLELTPKDVVDLRKASLVIYQRGFQPAVDDAVGTLEAGIAFDVSTAADLSLRSGAPEATGTGGEGATGAGGEDAAAGHDEAGHDETDHSSVDPHFWLDPVRYAAVVTAIGERLGVVDPPNAATYSANAAALVAHLHDLDGRYRAGLAVCESRNLVTGHAAFGYLADRYDLTQVSIAGVSPDQEPDAASIAELVVFVREHDVRTVYAETLVSPAIVETLARETGATVAVLDPIEGVTAHSRGRDYLEIMDSNLEILRKGQQCR